MGTVVQRAAPVQPGRVGPADDQFSAMETPSALPSFLRSILLFDGAEAYGLQDEMLVLLRNGVEIRYRRPVATDPFGLTSIATTTVANDFSRRLAAETMVRLPFP